MQFSVIYSIDVPGSVRLEQFFPPECEALWDQTEGDNQYEYSYLEGRWETGEHRQFCAILNREQFEEFVSRVGLVAESTETMGSIGAPGCGFGCVPAISFNDGGCEDAILNAYVTPLPCRRNGEPIRKDGATDRDWERVRQAVINQFK